MPGGNNRSPITVEMFLEINVPFCLNKSHTLGEWFSTGLLIGPLFPGGGHPGELS